MTTLQIILIVFWATLDIVWSFFCIRDLIKGQFVLKNGGANVLTALWLAVNITVLFALTVIAFI